MPAFTHNAYLYRSKTQNIASLHPAHYFKVFQAGQMPLKRLQNPLSKGVLSRTNGIKTGSKHIKTTSKKISPARKPFIFVHQMGTPQGRPLWVPFTLVGGPYFVGAPIEWFRANPLSHLQQAMLRRLLFYISDNSAQGI
jgi:hypothetical protein